VKLTGENCRESEAERAFIAKHEQAWVLPVADVDAPKGKPVREVTVSRAGCAPRVCALPAGETFFDVAAATGAKVVEGENGADKPAARLAFETVAERDGIANVYWQNDYFGVSTSTASSRMTR